MTRKKQYQDLYVYMNGIAVGTLVHESTGNLIFKYDDDWLNWKNRRPISLSMPLTEIPYKGYVVDCYFDNLLPDSELIRERIQARFNAPSKKCFDLLSFIGRDCVGALQLLTQSTVTNVKIIQFDDVKTLVVERFDRRWADNGRWLMRLPQEDLCQALSKPSGLKYESDGGPGIQDIMKILLGSQEASNDRKKFIKSVFLFW